SCAPPPGAPPWGAPPAGPCCCAGAVRAGVGVVVVAAAGVQDTAAIASPTETNNGLVNRIGPYGKGGGGGVDDSTGAIWLPRGAVATARWLRRPAHWR